MRGATAVPFGVPAVVGLRRPWAVCAVTMGAYAVTFLGVGRVGTTLLSLVVQGLFAAPGVIAVARLAPAGARWLPAITFGPLVGLGASSVALLAFWAAGARGPWLLVVAPLAALAASAPIDRLRGRWRFAQPHPSDVRMLLLTVLIVPVVVAAPFAHVGADMDGGRAYRKYFTADYVWERAVVAELAKGEFLPANPYYTRDVMHYYWLPHLESAVEHRAWPGIDLDTVLLTRSVIVGAMFLAALYGVARLFVPVPWAALVGVACGVFLTSFEGVAALWIHWRDKAPLSFVRFINIDAVTRWFMNGMPIDGLQRVLWYQPHHATGYVLGFLGLLAVARRTRDRDEGAFAAAGVLLALSTVTSSFAGLMFTVTAAVYEGVRTVLTRTWRAAPFNAAYAALPLVMAAAVVTALHYVEQPADSRLSVIRFGINVVATRRFWSTTFLSIGPAVLLAVPGAIAAWRHRRVDLGPLLAMFAVAGAFYFYVDVRDHEDVYVGWRVGHLYFMAFISVIALSFVEVRGWPSRARAGALTAMALVAALALPTTAIDIYNTQDLVPGGYVADRIEVLSTSELEGLAWLREHTTPEAVVQVDMLARGSEMWAYIPAFAERRMGAGVPLSMVPLQKYQEAARRVEWMYQVADPRSAHALAARVGIDYIVVGPPERKRHPGIEARFASAGDVLPQVFHNEALSIYAVQAARH